MQEITPFLWFDDKAEEAMNFYVSIFKNSKVGTITRFGEAGPGPKGTVMSVTFQLDGRDFFALNGGPLFKFTEAISFFVNCERQVRPVLANHSLGLNRNAARPRCWESKAGYGSHASNDQD